VVVTARSARFDGQAPGTPESAWAESTFAARAPSLDLDTYRRLVVVSAHPDDETLGAAGLIASLHARGAALDLIVASDGEASHAHLPAVSAAALGRRRRDEMGSAIGHLAPGASIRWLGLPDGRLAEHEDDMAGSIGRLIGADGSGTLVAAPWRADGHPDHEAVARAVARAAGASGAAVVEFPVWAWLWATPGDPRLQPERLRLLHLDGPVWHRKQRAIAEHRSQIAPLGDDPDDPDDRPVLTSTFLDHFRRRYETYLPAGGGVA
jgi:LmbE family N-acetylglucosaminyl deacetylase